jgi:hypothetical protein
MSMSRKDYLFLLILLPILVFVPAPPGLAQDQNSAEGIVFMSAPEGTTIRLNGAFKFAGKTPFTISQRLIGPYSIHATKRGYESKRITLEFNREISRSVVIDLQPLSPAKAAFRSTLLPGWGQHYKGSTGRGIFFGSITLSAAAGTLITYSNYRSDRNARDQAEQTYRQSLNGGNIGEAQLALSNWQAKQSQAEDSQNQYQRALAITAGLWMLNVLDALLMPPKPGPASKEKPAVATSLSFDESKIGLQIKF